MKATIIILSAVIIVLLIAVGALLFLRGNEDGWLCRNGQTELIGGQKDEHGCLAPAGYSWCEAKQKCLRVWEENCSKEPAGKGTIEGSLGYPSEGIPAMKICAENVAGNELTCTEKIILNKKYTYGKGYQLEVPAGTYRVFASLAYSVKTGGALDSYRAYYSQFVTCGIDADCPSHLPIDVTVKAGEAKTKIDPIDWYNM